VAIALAAGWVAALPGCDGDEGSPPVDGDAGDGAFDVPAEEEDEDAPAEGEAGDAPEEGGEAETPAEGGEADAPEDASFVPPEPGMHDERMVVDEVNRAYVIYVPESAVAAMGEGRVPFLIALHGAGDTGEDFITGTGLTDTADDNAFVVAGPDGFRRGWFVQADEGWPGADGYETSLENDIVFMLQLVDLAYDSYGTDRRRVYVVGHSRGAGMTALLAFGSGGITTSAGRYSSPFAAYGVNAGYDATGGSSDMAAASPKRPIWIIHGASDSVVPFSYGESLAEDLTAAGWEVTFTRVPGGPHNWLWQRSYGHSNQELWDFFAANPLP
jgi:poly(3-hydroxybutyrate) depolymerase